MKFKINYLENEIALTTDNVFSLEIENKRYFHRLVKDLYDISHGFISNDINFFDDEGEVNPVNKIKTFVNFFDYELDDWKYENRIIKYIISNITEEDKAKLNREYTKILKIFRHIINDMDLSLSFSYELEIEKLIKLLKMKLELKNDLLNNLFMIIDLENILNKENILVFVNLKQYLTNEELLELYKYGVYHQMKILLIDSQRYHKTLKYEKKLVIDLELDEFMIQCF